MVRHVDAIFSQGAFRPLEPLVLPEGTRVHLSAEEKTFGPHARVTLTVPIIERPFA